MVAIRPFRALRPAAGFALAVAAPPYDVVDTTEARALAAGNPDSFLRVSRPEIGLPEGVDPAADLVHQQGARALEELIGRGTLVQDDAPGLFVYRLSATLPGFGPVRQTGLVCCTSVAEYESGVIATHEHTRPDKELDRVRHVDALNAHDEPVFLMHRPAHEIGDLIDEVTAERDPLEDLTAVDGVRHTLWRVPDAARVERFVEVFSMLPRLYVADGHHRSAAAARVAAARRAAGTPGPETEHFLSVVFSADQLAVLPYNRVVRLPPDTSPAQFLYRLSRILQVTPSAEPVLPGTVRRFGMYLHGNWYVLDASPERLEDGGHPASGLDVAILQDRVLGPLLGIADPRTDPRISFVGGIRGTEELQRRVDAEGHAVAFSLHATSPFEVMDVADAGSVMPPKSTWFEPKLRSGLFVHRLT